MSNTTRIWYLSAALAVLFSLSCGSAQTENEELGTTGQKEVINGHTVAPDCIWHEETYWHFGWVSSDWSNPLTPVSPQYECRARYKNNCSDRQNLNLDVANNPDPGCKWIEPGQTQTWVCGHTTVDPRYPTIRSIFICGT